MKKASMKVHQAVACKKLGETKPKYDLVNYLINRQVVIFMYSAHFYNNN